MKKILSTFTLLLLLSTSIPALALDEVQTYRSILKVRTYEHNTTNNTYSLSSLGSAVALGNGLLLTNAHVVFDKNQNTPSGFYEVCRTIDFHKKPVCFTTGELVAYDEESDLAILKYQEPSDLTGVKLFKDSTIDIGSSVIVYGYPGIGGENISRTEGNIAGYEDPYYKIDGAVDHGNSGGGAFNKNGELIGIPSRVESDNAVIGYMIPITTIRDFLAKKTKGYTKITLSIPRDFKAFIKSSELGERSQDSINDANIKTTSLKKYGLKFAGKLEGVNSFLYLMSFNNLSESYVAFGCFRFGGKLGLEELDNRSSEEDLKKYKTIKSYRGENNRFTVNTLESLVSSENSDLVNIYDSHNTCAATLYGIDVNKNKNLIDQAIAFITSGIKLKKSFIQSSGFNTQLFRTEALPSGISVKEVPAQGGDTAISIGYFGSVSNSGETLGDLKQKKKGTIDAYFLGGTSIFDSSPSDSSLKPSDYSMEAFRTIYEKKYTGKDYRDTNFRIVTSKNNKNMILGTARFVDGTSSTSIFVFSYPYVLTTGTKKEYYELTYTMYYEGGNDAAMKQLEAFFTNLELIGTSPF